MKVITNSEISLESQIILESLRQAVSQTLERKRRLGQYFVIWKNGRPVLTGEDTPKESK